MNYTAFDISFNSILYLYLNEYLIKSSNVRINTSPILSFVENVIWFISLATEQVIWALLYFSLLCELKLIATERVDLLFYPEGSSNRKRTNKQLNFPAE